MRPHRSAIWIVLGLLGGLGLILAYATSGGNFAQVDRRNERGETALHEAFQETVPDLHETSKMLDTLHFELDASGLVLTITNPGNRVCDLTGVAVRWFTLNKGDLADQSYWTSRAYPLKGKLAPGENRSITMQPPPTAQIPAAQMSGPFQLEIEALFTDGKEFVFKPVLSRDNVPLRQ